MPLASDHGGKFAAGYVHAMVAGRASIISGCADRTIKVRSMRLMPLAIADTNESCTASSLSPCRYGDKRYCWTVAMLQLESRCIV